MGSDDIEERFARAALIASKLPTNLQEAAFLRALDELGEKADPSAHGTRRPGTTSRTPRKAIHVTAVKEGIEVDPVRLFGEMHGDAAPEINGVSGSLAHSLALLLVAKREFDIDGLTSPQIAAILTDKFRHRYSRQAITQALDRAGRLVDRRTGGRAVTYRLMRAGEDWLATQKGTVTTEGTIKKRTKRKRTKQGGPVADASVHESTADHAAAKPDVARQRPAKRSTTRPGPKASLQSLIDKGFFKEPQTMATLRAHLLTNFAREYSLNDLAPALVRLLREGKLERTKADGGSYEYTQS